MGLGEKGMRRIAEAAETVPSFHREGPEASRGRVVSLRSPWGLGTERRLGLRSLWLLAHRSAWCLQPSTGKPSAAQAFPVQLQPL